MHGRGKVGDLKYIFYKLQFYTINFSFATKEKNVKPYTNEKK